MASSPPSNFSWVVPGKVAGLALPRAPADYRYLLDNGIKHLVCLCERKPPYHDTCPEVTLHHIKITDFTPPSPAQIERFLSLVEESNAKGEGVAVHCMHGHGRTGTMLACYLVKTKKMTGVDGINEIRRLRHGSIETREQEKFEIISSISHPAKPVVSCDFCTGTRLQALKSCLVCQTSYCETHLEPHQRVPRLVKHKLIDPVENLEDRMCKKHERPLELFCRTDRTCVCQFCTEADHKTHDTVSLEEECEKQKAQLGKTGRDVQQIIQERLQKVQEIKLSVETSKREMDRKLADSVEAFSALVRSMERSQAELIQEIEDKHRAAEKRAEGFIQELEQEIAELKRRSAELEQLSHTEDHLHLLQISPSLSTPPHSKDWSQISVRSSGGTGLRVLSQLEDRLMSEMKKLRCVELKRIQQYAVDVSLDPDTAHPNLILSEDGKHVRAGRKQNVPDNPDKFDRCLGVLGKQSFSSGRFYYEVQVGGEDWDLGVVRESINRKGEITLSLEDGHWVIYLRNGSKYKAVGERAFLSLRDTPRKVGVFVDCEEGQVSFYDVETKSHIYSFTGCTFTEKLFPFFSPQTYDGENPAPLIISPVNL